MNLETIKTYEDICKLDGVDPIASLPYQNPVNSEEAAVNNFSKVIRINRILNDGWKPDWSNWDEYKYYPWFEMDSDETGSGSGFSYLGYDCALDHSTVGSRLVYKTRELAKFAGTVFLEEYKGYMVIQK